MKPYDVFRKYLFLQDCWKILGQWVGLGMIGIGLVLLLISLISPQTVPVFISIFWTTIAAIYTLYAWQRRKEAERQTTVAMQQFFAPLDTKEVGR